MQTYVQQRQQEENRSKAFISSMIFHVALLALLFLYRFSANETITEAPIIAIEIEEWGGGGDNAAKGEPDRGMNSTPAPAGEPTTSETEEPAPASKPTPTPPTPTKTDAVKVPANTPTTEDPEAAAIKKRQDDERRRQEAIAEENRRREKEEADQRAAAAAEKARQEQARRDKIKNSGLGSGGTGAGRGNGGKPGDQGIPGGTGDNPFGRSPGTGGGQGGGDGTGTGASVGGGLGGRKIVSRGRISDNSQKQGKVVIEVCVDSDGSVSSATYTQRGSTTNDSELKSKALAAARQYKFGPSSSDEQCGTITFNFRLQ